MENGMTVSSFAEKAMLDWLLGGATPTRPTAWFVGLDYGTPTSAGPATELTAAAYARQTVVMSAAASPAGTAISSDKQTWILGSSEIVKGAHIWNSSAGGSMLWGGTLSAAVTAQSISIAAGSLITSIA